VAKNGVNLLLRSFFMAIKGDDRSKRDSISITL